MSFISPNKLSLVMQSEASECGLACIAMVCGYYGGTAALFSLRRDYAMSSRGASIKSLREIAQALHFKTRPVRLDLDSIADLHTPCILHWDMNHFVVLSHATRRRVIIFDPARGKRVLKLTEVSKHFTGVALELAPTSEFQPAPPGSRYSLRDLMGKVIGLKRSLAQAALLGIFLELTAVMMPFYSQLVIDQGLANADMGLLKVLGIGFILLVVFRTLISAVRSWGITLLNTDFNYQWLGNVFAHLLRLPQSYFETRHLGDIISKFSSVSSVQRTLTSSFIQMVVDGILVTGTAAMMLIYSVKLTCISLLAVGLYLILRGLMNQPLRDAANEQLAHVARQQNHFYETVRGIQSVKLSGAAGERHSSWLNILVRQLGADLSMQRMSIGFQSANGLIFGIERVCVIWLGALLVLDKQFSVGMLFAFLAYKDQFSSRLSALIDRAFELQNLRVHGERIADIVFTAPEPEQKAAPVDLRDISPSIELKSVSFRYSRSDPWILEDISLKIEAGECVALTGQSGCGKTTLVKIILGLIAPSSGEILIGGRSIDDIGAHHYRRMAATVMQDDSLFSGTIGENISFFCPDADDARIAECATRAAIDQEIARMPMKYNSELGNIGSSLSGGQRQRILLARALYRQPKILVLDEATSHLDITTEEAINTYIKEIKLTRIIVAHRPETIAVADRAILMRGGRIVDGARPKPSLSLAEVNG
jgi:ATP-binding cassette subfamily B protein RaxB